MILDPATPSPRSFIAPATAWIAAGSFGSAVRAAFRRNRNWQRIVRMASDTHSTSSAAFCEATRADSVGSSAICTRYRCRVRVVIPYRSQTTLSGANSASARMRAATS